MRNLNKLEQQVVEMASGVGLSVTVPPTPCKLWDGPVMTNGYGRRRYKGRREYAHRAAYEDAYGPIPNGMFVCHHCDVPLCIEPTHFFLATNAENIRDMWAKNRGFRMARKQTCQRGHTNWYIAPNGTRHCRTCRNDWFKQ